MCRRSPTPLLCLCLVSTHAVLFLHALTESFHLPFSLFIHAVQFLHASVLQVVHTCCTDVLSLHAFALVIVHACGADLARNRTGLLGACPMHHWRPCLVSFVLGARHGVWRL
jgi:hypothetical protein